ncbi:lysylphosphatidylglycerol synthase transmembrane domain-containing protein [Shouchella lonarensis]|uniref:Phosphatidylglycerol lysyltransferase n=1 Tax=Shouchella lonarensis TaxID=1464122 RepID=A0A1G6LFA4_9BACI|nr:lysylphosphatidylglycerol synthase transmembrane domain-containing protein [Shouchella lonarensis]SDC42102.1 hypothetical protein SAMN05421737_108113 [Shouchella lonarensis]
MNNDRKLFLQLSFFLLIGGGCALFLFRNIDMSLLKTGFFKANLWWLLLAFLLFVLTWVLEAMVLAFMAKANRAQLSFSDYFQTTMLGLLFNQITPLASGGQPAQLYLLTKKGVEGGRASSILMIKFIVFQVVLVLAFGSILFAGYDVLAGALPKMKGLVLIGFVIHLCIIVFLFIVALNQRLAMFLVRLILRPIRLFNREKEARWRASLAISVTQFHQESHRLLKDKWLLFRSSVVTLIQILILFSIPYFIFQAFSVQQLTLFVSSIYHAFIMIFSTVVPTPGGSGAAEYTFKEMFHPYMGPETLLLSMLFWRLFTAYTAVIVGLFYSMRMTNKPKLKQGAPIRGEKK